MGHSIAHTQGQYQCQKCEETFKTRKDMAEHIKKDHGTRQQLGEYGCEHCGLVFNALTNLRNHIQRNHTSQQTFECDNCGLKLQNDLQLIRHNIGCQDGYEDVRKPNCRYFAIGRCWKGEQCKFSHIKKQNKQMNEISACKNGPSCFYLRRGTCRYVHEDLRYDSQSKNSQNKQMYKLCRYQDQCFKNPHCPFIHKESDFPKLPKTKNPPIWDNITMWQEY